jgi:Tol biopolymer transport system component
MRPLLSANGHWIAFVSTASDLVPGQVDNGSSLNVFLFNQVSGKVFLVDSLPGSTATATEGITPNDNGEVPLALSANGRCVVFQSYSSDLATGDFNRRPDVFATCRNGGDD